MEVEEAEPGRAMTPEEVLDELRDEVRESEPTYETHEPHEHTHCATEDGKKERFCLGRGRGRLPPAFRQGLADPLSLSLSLTSRAQVKEELEEARRESANAEAEVSDLRQEIDRIQVRQSPRSGAADLRANEPS